MPKARQVSVDGAVLGYAVRCPACDEAGLEIAHVFLTTMQDGSPGWVFNGNLDRPTFTPSMLATTRENRCHSFVTDGRIHYLDDCTHAMKGQTIELPEF